MALEFDKMTVDTSLAQDYLLKEKELANFINNYEKELLKTRYFDGKTFVENMPPENQLTGVNSVKQIKVLASILKNNMDLFAQLEYHFRKIPLQSTLAQLNLVIKYALCQPISYTIEEHMDIEMNKNMPIIRIGQVMRELCVNHYRYGISACKETLAIVHLLVSICHHAGFGQVFAILEGEQIGDDINYYCLNTGTLGVVCDDADVDSAVDVFITSIETTPWGIQRILIQENVYQQFKDALQWKCNLNKQERERNHAYVCAETMYYGNKTFVIDPLSPFSSENSSVITVQAYRTTKELLSLADKCHQSYLSLWSNNVEQINEIVYEVKSIVVWVNNYADFRGPPQITSSIFPVGNLDFAPIELMDRAKKWVSLDFEKREQILRKILNKNDKNSELIDKLDDLSEGLQSFVHIGKDFTCTIVENPFNITCVDEDFPSSNICELLLNGKAVAVFSDLSAIERELSEMGVPVVTIGHVVIDPHFGSHNYSKKVIWMNRGTIFAN